FQGKVARNDPPALGDGLLDHRGHQELPVQQVRNLVPLPEGGELGELPGAFLGEGDIHRGTAQLVPAQMGVGQIGAGEDRLAEGILDLQLGRDRKSTRLNSSHVKISYAVICLKKKTLKFKFSRMIFFSYISFGLV